ncbi:superoxide dismutase [Myroides indicus]|nr:superoxide dismutase [Myroides indicus]
MMNHSYLRCFFLFSILTLGSCNNPKELIEVQIPEREVFVESEVTYPNPSSIKTKQGPMEMPGLPYQFDELSDLFKPDHLLLHYNKIHLKYADQLNLSLHQTPIEKDTITTIVFKADNKNEKLKNLAGGYYNHNIFWKTLTNKKDTQPNAELQKAINNAFGNMSGFKKEFKEKALELVGSGWLWLISKNNSLAIVTTANNENPLMGHLMLGTPLLAIDLWEHSYYQTYQDNLHTYIDNCIQHLNWEFANEQYLKSE